MFSNLFPLPFSSYAARGDCVVALHRIGNASVIKVVDIK